MSQRYDRYSQFPVTFLYIAQKPAIVAGFFMVGLFGFEPKTSSMSTKRSNQLSYNPMSDEFIIHDMREICKMPFAISCIWLVTEAVSTLQLAILLWIAVSAIDAADPICFKSICPDSQKQTSAGVASLHLSANCLYVEISQKSDIIIQANTPPCRIL